MTTPTADHDPFLWLEEVTGDDALAWVAERNAGAEATLGALPGFTATRDAVLGVLDADDRIPLVGKAGDWYYNVWRDAAHERGLWRRTTLASYRTDTPEWDVLLDLDALGEAEDEKWVWHGAQVLRVGPLAHRRALVTLSRGGSDADTTRELDLDTRTFIAPEDGGFVRPEGKGGVAWVDADTLLVATDTGPGSLTTSGYPRIARRWRRGTPLADAPVVHEGAVDDMAVGVGYDATPGHERAFVHRMMGFYTSETHLLGDDDTLVRIDVPDSAEPAVWREHLLVHLREEWTPAAGGPTYPSGSLLVADLDAWLGGERDLVALFTPTATRSLAGWTRTRHRLVLVQLEDVVHRVEVLTPPTAPGEAWERHDLAGLPPYSSVGVRAVDATDDGPDGDLAWLDVSGYLTPPTLALVDLGASGAPGEPTPLKASPARFDASTHTVTQRFATSDDGTRIPYFVVAPHAALAGDAPVPTVLYGYGGFEVSLTPGYSGGVGRAWLARGGAYVVANIRGGGEYGPAWHQAALRENRHRAYEDFAAVARDLVATGLTTRDRLGIMGGSNGGLLVGNVLVRYPDLVAAVVCTVPLLDMLRYPHLLAGASWMAEYGDPDDPADRPFVEQISAYHRVAEGTTYPAVLLTTSTRDDRVHPGHARKTAARLEEVGADVTYWENVEGGHGGASTNAQAATKAALEWEFLADRLGLAGAPERG
ncbi:S9 family peptidase [Nocardioides sp. ChNu-153]|uniref:prolyl oligopeptidase family serine peptidase n=1 Tax=unclassified Nocardioides TaxID=2615069 RepID=UPI0024072DEE|nr:MULTISPECIES: prolyl oligopeptidase family serine peptidase [unclassified Nocardioides]MDF9717476.1 prolyl oligopeptidase family serine peptidase [Nocardioides sp. ChNu-99]MDN7120466.1 S9 family peptidase [Nocardioides sp. ChNu-153]